MSHQKESFPGCEYIGLECQCASDETLEFLSRLDEMDCAEEIELESRLESSREAREI